MKVWNSPPSSKAVQVTVRLALIRGAVWGFRGSSAGVGEVQRICIIPRGAPTIKLPSKGGLQKLAHN